MSKLPPPPRMAHVGQIEPALSTYTAGVFQAGKPCVKKRRQCIGARTGILRTEIEVVTMPFSVEVNDIIPTRILGWGLNVFQLQDSVCQFCCLCLHFHLDAIRQFWLGWTVNPRLLPHRVLKVNTRPFDSHPIYCLQTTRNSHPITDNSLIFYPLISSLLMEVRISAHRIHAGHEQKYRRNSRQSHLQI